MQNAEHPMPWGEGRWEVETETEGEHSEYQDCLRRVPANQNGTHTQGEGGFFLIGDTSNLRVPQV